MFYTEHLRAPESASAGQAQCQTALSRQRRGRSRARCHGPGLPERCQSPSLIPNTCRHQHMQPGPSKFQVGSSFLCSGFSAKMTKASLSTRAGVLLLFVLALSWDWILHPSFCTLGLVSSGLINSLVSLMARSSPLGHCNRTVHSSILPALIYSLSLPFPPCPSHIYQGGLIQN